MVFIKYIFIHKSMDDIGDILLWFFSLGYLVCKIFTLLIKKQLFGIKISFKIQNYVCQEEEDIFYAWRRRSASRLWLVLVVLMYVQCNMMLILLHMMLCLLGGLIQLNTITSDVILWSTM